MELVDFVVMGENRTCTVPLLVEKFTKNEFFNSTSSPMLNRLLNEPHFIELNPDMPLSMTGPWTWSQPLEVVSHYDGKDSVVPQAMIVRLAHKHQRTGTLSWMFIRQQNSSACLAQHMVIDVAWVMHNYQCYAGLVGLRDGRASPATLNLSVVGFYLRPSDGSFGFRYECAGGVDTHSPNFSAALSKLTAYKARAKATLTRTLFVSMVEQNYDDVYAVYTGILGALFGAFALLVTTLFVYLVAAVKRSFC